MNGRKEAKGRESTERMNGGMEVYQWEERKNECVEVRGRDSSRGGKDEWK